MQENRRKETSRLFGVVDVSIPVIWLVTILVGGVLHLGIIYNQFSTMQKEMSEIKLLLKDATISGSISAQRNLLQDEQLQEHDRRINKLEDIIIRRRMMYQSEYSF